MDRDLVKALAAEVAEDARTKLLSEESKLSTYQLCEEFVKASAEMYSTTHLLTALRGFYAWVDFNLSSEASVVDFHELQDSFDECDFDELSDIIDE